jgi:hypothetical protein
MKQKISWAGFCEKDFPNESINVALIDWFRVYVEMPSRNWE